MPRKGLELDLGGAETPHFEGFMPDALRFFEELAAEQNRDWFQANKARYETGVRDPLASLVADLSAAVAARDLPWRGTPKTALFRIHRDVRFSKDKRPYKTNAGAVLTRGGDKADPGILYFHLAPEECFVAAGFYHPEPGLLADIRRRIAERPHVFRSVAEDLHEVGLALSQQDKLTRSPKGFEGIEDVVIADAVKLKSFIVRRRLPREALGDPGLIERLADFAEAAAPVLRLG